jgi:hypothetical protein
MLLSRSSRARMRKGPNSEWLTGLLMLKITLRELFLITVIVALALGWFLDHRRQHIEHIQVLKAHRKNELEWIGTLVARDREHIRTMLKLSDENRRLRGPLAPAEEYRGRQGSRG